MGRKTTKELFMGNNNESYNIKGVERAFQILDLACEKGSPISISEVCDALGCNSNMAFRLLSSIQNSGYLDKDPYTGLYFISIKSLRLSTNVLQSMELRKMAMPYLELLWTQYPKANVNLAVIRQQDIIMLERIEAQTVPRTFFTPGRVVPFHCTGIGKILTCNLPDEEIDELIRNKGLRKFTEKTICTPEGIKEELKKVRAERIGRDRNEFIEGDNCSAAPILNKDNQTIAAISMSALEPNMTAEEIEAAIPKLKETAARISSMLGCISA